MRLTALPALVLAGLLLAHASALAYSSTQSQASTTPGWNKTFTYSSLPTSSGNVSVAVTIDGDFGHSSEYADIYIDGVFVGTMNPQPPGNVNCTVLTTTYTVGAAAVNDGTLTVRADASSAVDFCPLITYTVTVSYNSNSAPSISNVGNQSTNEDTAGSVGFTVSDAEDSNGSLAVSATSSNQSVIANGGLSISASGGNRTLTMNPVGNASGSSTITLTVTDSGGLTDTDSFTLTVNPVNDPPVANAGGSYSGNEGSPIAMNGSGSSDIDNAITGWNWDCDNDSVFETTATSATGAECTFIDDGTYTVGLQVVDAAGATSATSTATVTVSNVAPTVAITGNQASSEGTPVSLGSSAGDASSVDAAALTYAWSVTDPGGASVASGSGTSIAFTPNDDGNYTATVTVTDPQGATGTDTVTVVVVNVAPSVFASGPTTGTEGTAVTFTATGSDVSSVDQNGLAYTWLITDAAGNNVGSDTGTSASFFPDDDGTYTATVTVTDPQGATANDSVTFVASNVAPTATASGPTTGVEGSQVTFSVSASDPGTVDNANLTHSWGVVDAGGNSVGTGTGTSLNWTPTDDGTYTATVVTTDPQSATGTDSVTIVVSNANPEISTLTGPTTGDEGSLLSFAATVTDVGADDIVDLVLTWDWGDGSATETGLTPDHTFADDGTYTVTVTLDDQDGGTDTDTITVTVANIAPIIDSTPATTASEAVQYTYAPTVVDPGDEVFTWSLSASAPAAMTIDPTTGAIAWTPTYADAQAGTHAVVLTVDDGDGDTDAQSWVITVIVADTDGDGLPDGWEIANGLDPLDPNDVNDDPDGDGLTNGDEFDLGQDPNSFDGPTAPVLVEPIAGVETANDTPDLVWDDATDPQNEPLTYSVEVYDDAALTNLITSASGIAPDGTGQTLWKVDIVLVENTVHWWRARANDGNVDGPWATEESFLVNARNDEPETPALTAPIDGAVAATVRPTLEWSEVVDIDQDAVTYDVAVFDAAGATVTGATGIVGDGVSAEWMVDMDLTEDAAYTWTARGVDEHGLAGDWAQEEDFFLSTDNAAPSDVVFTAPLDGQSLTILSPTLECTESIDPEGGPIEYQFELDTVASFDSTDYVAGSVSAPLWDLGEEGISLPDDSTIYARVRAIDEGGVASGTDTITFFVSTGNDAPDVPVLSAPADGESTTATPTLVVEDPTDPEGDVVYIEFAVASDVELVNLVVGVDGVIVEETGTTSWTVPSRLEGTHYWTARAVDEHGATSDWAAPWSFVAPGGESDVPPPPDGDETGCDCESSVAGGNATLVWLLLLVPLALRRRRA